MMMQWRCIAGSSRRRRRSWWRQWKRWRWCSIRVPFQALVDAPDMVRGQMNF
ncbi:hypothetical protein Hanom_Chr04g00344731 [Helianthus anomalus]